MNEHHAIPTVRSIGEVLFRNKKKIIVFPLLALALGAAVFVYCPRTYRSESQIFLRVGRESIGVDPAATAGQTISMQSGDRKDEVKSAVEILKSRSVISQVVDVVGPEIVLNGESGDVKEPNPILEKVLVPVRQLTAAIKSLDPVSDREEAIVLIERHLQVDAERESTVIEIKYDAKTPLLAQQVCSAIVEIYRDEHMRIHRDEASGPFFTEQQNRLQKQLDDSMESLRAAKSEMGLSSIESRRATLEAQFSAIELDRLSTDQQLSTSQARLADLDAQLAKVPERLVASKKSIPNQGADLMREQLYALQVKSLDLHARYSDSHPLVQAIDGQLEQAKQLLGQQSEERTETTDDINPIHRDLALQFKNEQNVLAGLKARAKELRQQKETVLADLRAVNQFELKLDQLNRQVELARGKYFQYARTMEESRMDHELENQRMSNVSVVQPATFAEKPISPSKPLVALATLVLATAGTAALVLGSERLGDRLRNESDIEHRLGLPVLGAIPGDRLHRRVLPIPTNGRKQAEPHQPSAT